MAFTVCAAASPARNLVAKHRTAGTVDGMADLVYEASEYNAGLPVAVAELDAIIARSGKPIKETSKLIHFLTRVRETIDSLNVDIAHLRRRVDELSVQSGRRGVPSTLTPADALRYADPQEIEAVVDSISRQRLTTLRAMVAQATIELNDIENLRGSLETTVRELNEAGSISEETTELLEALTKSPELDVTASHVLEEGFYAAEDEEWEKEHHKDVAEAVATARKAGSSRAEGSALPPEGDNSDQAGLEDAGTGTLLASENPQAEEDNKIPEETAEEPRTEKTDGAAPEDADDRGVDDLVSSDAESLADDQPSREEDNEPSGVSQVTAVDPELIAAAPAPVFDLDVQTPTENPFEEDTGWATDIVTNEDTAGSEQGYAENQTNTSAGGDDLNSELFDDTDPDTGDDDLNSELFDDTDPDTGDADLNSELFDDTDTTPEHEENENPAPVNPFAR